MAFWHESKFINPTLAIIRSLSPKTDEEQGQWLLEDIEFFKACCVCWIMCGYNMSEQYISGITSLVLNHASKVCDRINTKRCKEELLRRQSLRMIEGK